MMQLGLIGKNESIQKFLCDSGGDQTDAYCYKRSSNQSALNESMGIYYEIYELFKFMLLHQLLYHPRETHTLYPHSSIFSSCITLYIYKYNLCITIITRIRRTNSVRNDEICLITITIILMNQAQIKIGLQSNRIKCAHGPLNNFNFLLFHLSVLPPFNLVLFDLFATLSTLFESRFTLFLPSPNHSQYQGIPLC